jgi:uncharacterized protein (TIGR00296 family)
LVLADDVGEAAVKFARGAIEAHIAGVRKYDTVLSSEPFAEPRGVFVTINRSQPGPEKLRGCIGFPYAAKPLGLAIREAAVAAATEDPRFPPVSASELESLVVEVSILTDPIQLEGNPQDYPAMVNVGEDGLIISRFGQSGLLLPQVATEFGFDSTEFLSQACLKAGLLSDSWLDKGTVVQIFQAEVFGESSPGGKITRATRES